MVVARGERNGRDLVRPNTGPGPLNSLGEFGDHLLFMGQESLDACAAEHPLEMCGRVGDGGEVETQLGGAPAAPEEVRVRCGEVVEEIRAALQYSLGNSERLGKVILRMTDDVLFRAWQVADPRRSENAGEIGVYYRLLGSFCAVLGIEVENSVTHVPFNG